MPFQDLIGQCNGIVIEHVLTYSLPNISSQTIHSINPHFSHRQASVVYYHPL